jgi:hypothetical protein
MNKLTALIAPAILCLSGCTNLVSGAREIAVAPSDTSSIDAVRDVLSAPNITSQTDAGHAVMIVKFAFDGTLNDRSRVPSDARETIVAYIAHRVPDTLYYPGAGMQDRDENMIDAAFGSSMLTVAESAKTIFNSISAHFLGDHPNGEIRVFVTGFSRGAATARQFMNIVDKAWRENIANSATASVPKLRFYALLYDTVSTGQNDNPALHLGLPPDLNYSMQFVASDEPRTHYPVDLDLPQNGSLVSDTYPSRINTVFLPGAHSDVGTSYQNGIGDAYRQITDYSLSMLGLISDRCFDMHSDPTLLGKHDSRGWIDRLTRVAVPNSDKSEPRPHRYVIPAPLTVAEARDIAASNEALSAINYDRPIETINERTETFGFAATRDGNELRLTAVQDDLVFATAELHPTADHGADFKFSFAIVPNLRSVMHFSPQVISRIKTGGSTVGVTYLSLKNGQRLNVFVDDVLIEYHDASVGKTTTFRTEGRQSCERSTLGSSDNPATY